MKNFKAVLIALLIGVTVFSAAKFFLVQKEKNDLLNTLSELKIRLGDLEAQKQSLLQTIEEDKELQKALIEDNSELGKNLNLTKGELAKLDTEFKAAGQEIERLNSGLSTLKTENEDLRVKIARVLKDKDELETKFSSMDELKKAIKELKAKLRQKQRGVIPQEKKNHKTSGADTAIIGNQGYIIKNGKSTYPARVRIEVAPIPE